MDHEPDVIDVGRPPTPWVGMAHDEAKEWFRDNPGAPMAEFDAWVYETFEPVSFLAGYGKTPGQPLTGPLQEALDDAHTGITRARDTEARRRESARRRAA